MVRVHGHLPSSAPEQHAVAGSGPMRALDQQGQAARKHSRQRLDLVPHIPGVVSGYASARTIKRDATRPDYPPGPRRKAAYRRLAEVAAVPNSPPQFGACHPPRGRGTQRHASYGYRNCRRGIFLTLRSRNNGLAKPSHKGLKQSGEVLVVIPAE